MSIAITRERIRKTLSEAITDNPVLVMGFRTRMRRATGFVVMGGYVLLLAVVLLITWYATWDWSYGGMSATTNAKIGQALFFALSVAQAWLFLLIVPSLTAGCLTQELERRTMELLALTPLTAGKIALGKHLSAFLYAMALLLSSLPLAGICLMLGGISPAEIAVTYVLLAMWCFLIASVGVFWSSVFKATAASVLFTYGACGFYMSLLSGISANTAIRTSMSHGAGSSSANSFVLVGLDPGSAPYLALATTKVCGLDFPLALVGFLLHGILGALLLFVAMTNVSYHRTEKALPVRVLLISLTVLLTWLIIGNGLSAGWLGSDPAAALQGYAGTLLPILCLITVIFATGPIKKESTQSIFAYTFSLGKVFRNDLGGGPTFMLLWTGATYATYGLTFIWSLAVQPITVPPPFWASYFQTGIAILAIIVGFCSVGMLASSVMQNRRNALALTLLFVIIMFGGYLIALIYYNYGPYLQSGIHGSRSHFYQVAAFWPMLPVLSIDVWQSADMPTLWWLPEDSWIVSSVAYLLIAGLALLAAGPALRKSRGVQEE